MSMAYSGSSSSVIGISFGRMNEAKKKTARAQEEARYEGESLSKAINGLQVSDGRLRMRAEALYKMRCGIGKRQSGLQAMGAHIDYVIKRFVETDNLCAQRIKSNGYECRRLMVLSTQGGIFGNIISGLNSIVAMGKAAWDSIRSSVAGIFKIAGQAADASISVSRTSAARTEPVTEGTEAVKSIAPDYIKDDIPKAKEASLQENSDAALKNPEAEAAESAAETDNIRWIPEVMQLSGASNAEKYFSAYAKSFTKLKWDQNKINALWEATEDINKQYDIQIDPRFLLAIIIQEGTGSFNTSSTNRAADGQHGVETDYAADLMKANSLIFGKILGYIYYGEEFREAVSENKSLAGINGEGDIFRYCNWNTPIVRMNRKVVETGVYAGHGLWGEQVKKHYKALGGDTKEYENYISGIDKSVVEKIVKDQEFKLPDYDFVPAREAQNSKGKPNGEYIIKGVR